MNIYKMELKSNRKSLIFWCIGMVFMILAGMSKYEGLSASGGSIDELMQTIPKAARVVLGISNFDLNKASGFYGILYLYLILIATIHAAMLGANILSKEERDKTVEFLLVKPVSRTSVLTQKLLAAFTNVIILNIVSIIFSLLIVNAYAKHEAVNGIILQLMLGMFFLQCIFLSIGILFASLFTNPKITASISTGVLMITFLLSIVVDLTEHLGFITYLTPFKYFDASTIMNEGIHAIYIILTVIILMISIPLSYMFYEKRDMTI